MKITRKEALEIVRNIGIKAENERSKDTTICKQCVSLCTCNKSYVTLKGTCRRFTQALELLPSWPGNKPKRIVEYCNTWKGTDTLQEKVCQDIMKIMEEK